VIISVLYIGPTHTEYAFNITTREEDIAPYLRRWGKEVGLETPSTPTCILFDEHEQFISFGYEAKQSYLSISGKEARNMFFFDYFKLLYRITLHIKSVNGKEMKALKVFTEALRFLKDDALKTIQQNTVGMKFTASDFTWVLTLPDSCDPSAKPFLREAATQAGIVTNGNEDKLVFTLESEAALAWCMKLSADGFITGTRIDLKDLRSPGKRHIVIIAEGNENINFAVHEVLEGGELKELHRCSVNDVGGQSVDRKYKEFLREIFIGVWDCYEKNYPSEVQRMMHDFSRLKEGDEDIQVICPFNLSSLACKHQNTEKFFEGVEGASWDEGLINISRNKLRLSTEGSCRTNQSWLQFQKSAFTYGIGVTDRFDELKHIKERKFTNKDGEWCGGLFIKLVEVGEHVLNKTMDFTFYPVEADQTMMNFYFYRTLKKIPKYVTEEGVEQIGCLCLNSPNTECGRSREVKLTITFNCMNMKIKSKDLTSGSESSTKFDFKWK
uniref:Uncharacterized protein n=1 Tax=Poecilia reticulata TaxID=8081 RepID=A0A3P9PXC6_POERE